MSSNRQLSRQATCISILACPMEARHIQLRFLFVQHLAREGVITMRQRPGTENIACISTKYAKHQALQRHLENCGVRSPVLSSGFMSAILSHGGRPTCDPAMRLATIFFEQPITCGHERDDALDFTIHCILFPSNMDTPLEDRAALLAYTVPSLFYLALSNACIHLRDTMLHHSHKLPPNFKDSGHCPSRLRQLIQTTVTNTDQLLAWTRPTPHIPEALHQDDAGFDNGIATFQ